MRTFDRDVPTIAGSRPGPGAPIAGWGAELFVGIERLPLTAQWWDDGDTDWDDGALWDDTTAFAAERLDATCSFQGVELVIGNPDTEGRLAVAECTLQLDNRSGEWSQYDPFGRLVYYSPGAGVDLWAVIDGEPWWLFSGQVSAWRETADGTVEVEAVDPLARWNQPLGEWDPGTYDDTPAERLEAIADLIGDTGPTRFATGDVHLHSFLSTATPLEEARAVALSDGGVLFADADGTRVYADRTWRGGRADQDGVRVFSANVCNHDEGAALELVTVWDLEAVTDDEHLVNVVQLTNLAEVTVEARAEPSIATVGIRTLAGRDRDQWNLEADGAALAAFLVETLSAAALRVDGFRLHLIDPRQDLWRPGIDLRIGDLIRFLHDQPALGGERRLDLNLIVASIVHSITPDGWTVDVATTRAVGNNVLWRWDDPDLAWDDPEPEWGY